jgi:hypothetical protein
MADHVGSELDRLQAARAAFRAVQARVEAGEPWPLAVAFGAEPEASWGPREVLTHVGEMLPYWLGEMERVIHGSPEPVEFGRLQVDALRVGSIERDRTLPIGHLFARIDTGMRDWLERLPTLTPAERAKRGFHPRHGEVPAEFILERNVLGHSEEHVIQLEEVLASAGRGSPRPM